MSGKMVKRKRKKLEYGEKKEALKGRQTSISKTKQKKQNRRRKIYARMQKKCTNAFTATAMEPAAIPAVVKYKTLLQ